MAKQNEIPQPISELRELSTDGSGSRSVPSTLSRDWLTGIFIPDDGRLDWEPPQPTAEQRLSEERAVAQAMLGSNQESAKAYLQQSLKILKSPEFRNLIAPDQSEQRESEQPKQVTLAMIKPRAMEDIDRSTLPDEVNPFNDGQVANFLLDQIESLDPIWQVSLPMNEVVEDWYAGKPKKNQQGEPPLRMAQDDTEEERLFFGSEIENHWEEVKALFHGSPVTFALFYDEDGEAIESLRDQIGTTWELNVLKDKEPDSLRVRHTREDREGKQKPYSEHSNLYHGSDSPESVQREIDIVIEIIEKYLRLAQG